MKLKTFACLFLLTLFASITSVVHAQNFSVIHTFTDGEDGRVPHAGVTIRGNTLYGLANGGPTNAGVMFEMQRQAENWGALILLTDFKVQSAVLAGRVVFHRISRRATGNPQHPLMYRLQSETPPRTLF